MPFMIIGWVLLKNLFNFRSAYALAKGMHKGDAIKISSSWQKLSPDNFSKFEEMYPQVKHMGIKLSYDPQVKTVKEEDVLTPREENQQKQNYDNNVL